MSNLLISEEQAERLGRHITGGVRGVDFEVYAYEAKPSRLTAFGVRLPDGSRIATQASRV
jgi:hypothetical protein